MSQHFSLLSTQNLSQTLPSSSSNVQPVFSPKHDLLLIPSADNTVTVAHLQKPLFRENLKGPFSFRPDGLLFNSACEGIIIDHERRKWRGGVGQCVWIDLDTHDATTTQDATTTHTLLAPLYMLNDNPDLAPPTQSDSLHANLTHIDDLMSQILPQHHSFLMVLYNEHLITCKLFGWIKVATLNLDHNDLYNRHALIATMAPLAQHPCKISLMEYGEYGMQLHNIVLRLPAHDRTLHQYRSSTNSPRTPSLAHVNKISRHLAHLQYLLLDKLPKVLEHIDSTWNAFYTNLLQKRLVHTYPGCSAESTHTFTASLLQLLINGERTHWAAHKTWLSEHATEKNLTKIIKSLHSTKSTIVSFLIQFLQPYIQHVLHHLTALRGHALHQQYVHKNELIHIAHCTKLIEYAKAFYAQTHQLMNQFSTFHCELMNFLSYLTVHQAKCANAAANQKQTPPPIPDIVDPASVNTHRLITFLYSLAHNGHYFEHLLKNPSLQRIVPENQSLFDPLQSYFSTEGSFTKAHQELIVLLSSLIDDMSACISQHVHVTQKTMIPVYDPGNVVGFVHDSDMYWAFLSSEKFVCLRIDEQNQLHTCILSAPSDQSVKQFQFYKVNESSQDLVLVFLMENGSTQESFIKRCVVAPSQFELCMDTSHLTQAVEDASTELPFDKERKCEQSLSQICVGTRGLCAAFGKQQFYIFDLEADEEEESEDDGEEDEEESH